MPLATGDLPLPTSIPPWMGAAIILFWLAVLVTAVRLLQWRRSRRAARITHRRSISVPAVDSAPQGDESTARTGVELSPPTPDAREGAG